MPLFFKLDIDENTRLAIWEIREEEPFFASGIPLQREITHPHKRLQHLAGRFLLPLLFPGFPHNEIKIAHTRKPFLPNEQYHFSISHCGNYAAALASTNKRVGIDVEFITPRVQSIMKKFLHPEELRFVNSQSPAGRVQLLSLLWSAKEAIYKWYGYGEVEFREMIRILPFVPARSGEINAGFVKAGFQATLLLHYQFIGELTLVWVASEV